MSYRYLLFYKPYQVLCQFTDATATNRRSTLKDYIPVPDVYAVGRLDYDSEGLMLLTNDGQLQHRLSHPRFQHPRTYWVQVEGIPHTLALEQLRQGVLIQNYRTRPAQVRLMTEAPTVPPRYPPIRFRQQIPTAWLEITLTEGRNRQVRRMTAAVGFPTLRLIRVAIANLCLTNLQPGQWRDLTPTEQQALNLLTIVHPTPPAAVGLPSPPRTRHPRSPLKRPPHRLAKPSK
ncbi:pseudouridine synthase [Trichothermofontia sichuanensis B231]|uniref:pseudouridine synthase n=1 Tax=Trichothermofontia sichuanensis TaxID=3045816 RepID=UPI0022475384|nr:pseudouridine synthase [Trichothermofontia sichuanensis]UZQ55014.1 pseudouridine synthase [Trichothermofontia sichuanensis B231]